MSRLISFIGFILLSAGQLLAQDGLRIMESLVMPSRIMNQDVKYSVCLPDDYYVSGKSYPVVYMLHGLGDDETAWLEYGRISQYYDAEIGESSVVPMIFIMPQGYRTYYVNDYQGKFLYQDMLIEELVPFIDQQFRTIPGKQHRGLIGYSMGGYGALILHLQHPDVFGSAVPLSISIRTDEQYMTEYGPEWDEQWGRLFGAVGIEGPGRITDYYKANNPFHIIPKIPPSEMNQYRIYIDNGDKEQTLCRSNEELHILMQNLNFPHEFRVREGGHSFEYWCSALPNALNFLSDAFEGKPYRGDVRAQGNIETDMNLVHPETFSIGPVQFEVFLPEEFNNTNRKYPALYISGNFGSEQVRKIVSEINLAVQSNEIGPMVIINLYDYSLDKITSLIPRIEDKFRLRNDFHFRSIIGYRESAEQVCNLVTSQVLFSSCVLVDAYLQKDHVIKMINEMPEDALKRTPFFIIAPSSGNYYEGNGNLHMMFRDKEIKHEYRVIEEEGEITKEIIHFISDNLHR